MLQGALNIEDLINKLSTVTPQEEEKVETGCDPPSNPTKNPIDNNMQEDGNEDVWTPVAPGKAARRHHPIDIRNKPRIEERDTGNESIAEQEEDEAYDLTYQERGGNPQISSPQ